MTNILISPPNKKLPVALFRHWTHSREEDRTEFEVYRPDGFAFPVSFGRDGFEMRRDGTFIQDVIGPADGIVQVPGRWRQIGLNQVGVRFDSARHPDYAFEVPAVDDDVLRLRLLPLTRRMPTDPRLDAFDCRPPVASCRIIDFSQAVVRTYESFPPQHVLVVSGLKPYVNMDVDLVPVVYIQHPEYWEIEVVGCLRGFGPPSLAPYTATLRLAGTLGRRGVEVVGATRRLRLDIVSDHEETPNGAQRIAEAEIAHAHRDC